MERTVEKQGFPYHIFLIGFMGSGKSSVAQELSKQLGIEALEMDAMIVEGQQMAITDIFAKYGEERFRDLESQLLIDLQPRDPAVISCGGGVVLRPENTGHMKKHGRVVLLTATPQSIYERVKDSTERPILNQNMSVEFIEGLMEKRRAKYLAAADYVIATDGKELDAICEEILQTLQDSNCTEK